MNAAVAVSAVPWSPYLYQARAEGDKGGGSSHGQRWRLGEGSVWPQPADVDALACRLHAAAQISSESSASASDTASDGEGSPTQLEPGAIASRLVFDADALCGDGPYVQVDHIGSASASGDSDSDSSIRCSQMRRASAAKSSPLAAAAVAAACVDACNEKTAPQPAADRRPSPLIRPQLRSNPFKTMMRAAAAAAASGGCPTTVPAALLPSEAAATGDRAASDKPQCVRRHKPRPAAPLSAETAPCVHCRSGSFLAFCYAADRYCIMYEVKPGDYCYKIAQDNGIPYAQFLRQNPGIDCTNLQVGQSVCLIPLSPNNHNGGGGGGGWTGGYKRQCKTHTVRSGEVCDEIADSYGIPLAELVARNDQSPEWRGCSLLRIGQQLCV
ncbi:hypothetical protein IWQ56_000994 [Coemansia nantahalensis]|nr:hypothetical protein IWQ56_000994 [Coemansia nantahalensis]